MIGNLTIFAKGIYDALRNNLNHLCAPVVPQAIEIYWVNPSKIGGMDEVFRGLAGLLRGISQGQSPREIPRSSPAGLRKTPSIPTLLLGFTFYLK